jgi:UDP-N-acetylmuramate dehydrogenase
VGSAANRTDTRDIFDITLLAELSALVSHPIRTDITGANLTTLSIGGPLAGVIPVSNEIELQNVLATLLAHHQPYAVIGFGSNLLISDEGFKGWVIKLSGEFRDLMELKEGSLLNLSAATSLMSVARRVSNEGLSGLEFAAGIPASLGGAVFMNAGAHGGEIAERIVSVRGVLANGEIYEWGRDELDWRYRSSGLPSGVVVTKVVIKLVPGDKEQISAACARNLAHRRATQPLTLPSAGSVFKNPAIDTPAGRVLEEAGLKGVCIGGAEVSTVHANWIVNPEKRARAGDVRRLIEICQRRVFEQSGIQLQPEVRSLSGCLG